MKLKVLSDNNKADVFIKSYEEMFKSPNHLDFSRTHFTGMAADNNIIIGRVINYK